MLNEQVSHNMAAAFCIVCLEDAWPSQDKPAVRTSVFGAQAGMALGCTFI